MRERLEVLRLTKIIRYCFARLSAPRFVNKSKISHDLVPHTTTDWIAARHSASFAFSRSKRCKQFFFSISRALWWSWNFRRFCSFFCVACCCRVHSWTTLFLCARADDFASQICTQKPRKKASRNNRSSKTSSHLIALLYMKMTMQEKALFARFSSERAQVIISFGKKSRQTYLVRYLLAAFIFTFLLLPRDLFSASL